MIFRIIAFLVVILLFAVIGICMLSDLIQNEKKINKKEKMKKAKTNSKKSIHY